MTATDPDREHTNMGSFVSQGKSDSGTHGRRQGTGRKSSSFRSGMARRGFGDSSAGNNYAKRNDAGNLIGFQLPKKTRNVALLLLTIPAMCLIRYLVINNKTEPVSFLVGSTATALRLYNYLIMGNWATVTTFLLNDTMPINFQQSSRESFRVFELYERLVGEITRDLSELPKTSNHGKLYSQLYNTNVCFILSKRAINNRIPPFCSLALNQISNNTLIRFLHRYGSLWHQLMNVWDSLPKENRFLDMQKNPDFVGLIASIIVDYHGIPNCIYYHLLVPTMLLITQETTTMIQTLNLTNILSVSLGLLVFGLVWISCREIFWDERVRLSHLIKAIPLSLICTSPTLQNRLRNCIKEERNFSW